MSAREVEVDGYADLLADLKARVRATQARAARAANTEVLRLYWSIGRDILERQQDRWLGEQDRHPLGRRPAKGVSRPARLVPREPALHA